jgi:hypothetical protein
VVPDWQKNLQNEEAAVTARQAAQDATTTATGVSRETGMAPLDKQLDATMAQPLPTRPAPQAMPEFKPKPVIDAKDYQGLSMALIGMALIGGVASKGNWMGASASLNGALKGYLDGNEAKAQKEYADYQTKFKEAQAKEKQANDEFEHILSDRNATINEQIQRYKIAAAKYDRQDMREAASQRSIDKMWEQLHAHQQALYQAEERHVINDHTVEAQNERSKTTRTAQSNVVTLTSDDIARRADIGVRDEHAAYAGLSSYTSKADIRAVSKALTDKLVANGNTGAEQYVKQAEVKADKTALNDTTRRLAGVERSTLALQKLEPDVIALAKKTAPTGSQWANVTINDLKRKFGDDPSLQQLFTEATALNREHIISVTMPMSNAQMHVSSGELGNQILNGDMPVGRLKGAIAGINNDIKAMHDALKQIQTQLAQDIAAPLPAGSGAPSAAAPGAIPAGWSVQAH